MIGGNATGEVVNPSGELSFIPIGVTVFEDALENDLDEILGDIGFASEAGKEAKEGPVVAFEEVAEPGEFSGPHRQHQVVVAGFVHGVKGRGGGAGGRGCEREGCGDGRHGSKSWGSDLRVYRTTERGLRFF